MKRISFLLLICSILLVACQKPAGDVSVLQGNKPDSIIVSGDSLTYEVLTTDTGGWVGVWNQPGVGLTGNGLDSISFGSPVYLPGGWKYNFISPSEPFQALLSVAARSFSDDIIVNLYKNGQLLKSSKNDAMKGVAKVIADVQTDSLQSSPGNPVLSYEVLVSETDTTKFESDAWLGHWIKADGKYNDIHNPLLFGLLAMPSGWKYTFKPGYLPFTMHMQASPYTKNGGKVTVNFFVNGQLVKTIASRDWIYDISYTVQ